MTSGVAAVIPAAGLGRRLGDQSGTPIPKALRQLGGRSLLVRSVDALSGAVDQVVVAAAADQLDLVREELADCAVPVQVVTGGDTRQSSVRLALAAVARPIQFVVVHDAARPLVPPEVVARVIAALRGGAAVVVPAIPVVDSLRQFDADGRSTPIDRSTLRAVQTPQGFRKDVLVEAHRRAPDGDATDDASLVERAGVPVTLVEGAHLAFKITTPVDLLVAQLLLRDESRRMSGSVPTVEPQR